MTYNDILNMEPPKAVQEQFKRLYAALDETDSAGISPDALSKALGPGINREALTNAAVEDHLPFGFMHRARLNSKRSVAMPKLAVWNWFMGNIIPIQAMRDGKFRKGA